jgi:phospholipase C
LPYAMDAWREVDAPRGTVKIHFENSGKATAVFQVRSIGGDAGPWTYTLGPQSELSDAWVAPAIDPDGYALSVHGPNGFMRTFRGSASDKNATNLDVRSVYDTGRCGIALQIRNVDDTPCQVRIANGYLHEVTAHALGPRQTLEKYWPLESHFGWYDLTLTVDSNLAFEQRIAGHLETGKDSMSDPAIGQR